MRRSRTTKDQSADETERDFIYHSISSIMGVWAKWVYHDPKYRDIEVLREQYQRILVNNDSAIQR